MFILHDAYHIINAYIPESLNIYEETLKLTVEIEINNFLSLSLFFFLLTHKGRMKQICIHASVPS